jgi:sulfite exporter TauE/SafE
MPELVIAFAAGIFGGFGHCIGMCGPVAAACALHGGRAMTMRLAPHLFYNAGRVITYSFVGALMGLGGDFLEGMARLSGIQNAVMISAGLVMSLMGFTIAIGRNPVSRLEEKGFLLFSSGRRMLESGSPLRFFPLGLLLGFMPCGLSYSIFIGSTASGNMVEGWAIALSFGLGTVPALLLFGVIVSYMKSRVRMYVYRLGGASIAILGVIFVVKGIRLYAQV